MLGIDKKLKKMLASSSSSLNTPDSLRKRGAIPSPSVFNKNMFNKPFNNMMGDWDKDGVNNIMDCKPNNFFKQGFGDEARVPIVDYPEQYGYKKKKVMMTPDEYMMKSRIAHQWEGTPEQYEKSTVFPSNVEKLKPIIASKEGKMAVPWIETKRGKYYDQEGRHRAVAARQLGIKKIPVFMVETDKQYISEEEENEN